MVDLNKSMDLKKLFNKEKLHALFGNKLSIYVIFSFIVSCVLLSFVYDISGNQELYDVQQNRIKQASSQLTVIENKLKKTINSNLDYFKQLATSPKSKSELSSRVTMLVANYRLTLVDIDLKNQGTDKANAEISMVIKGSYLNLIRFSAEMNKVVAASRVEELKVKKVNGSRMLLMSIKLRFAPPPSKEIVPVVSLSSEPRIII